MDSVSLLRGLAGRAVSFCLVCGALSSLVSAAPLSVKAVYGNAESRVAGRWQPLVNGGGVPGAAVRTGAGQLELRSGSGLLLLDTSSSATINQGEYQASQGQFYAEGPISMYAGAYHLSAEAGSTLRIDLKGGVRRVAAIKGSVRVAHSGRPQTLAAGQQLSLTSGAVTPFRELDTWYASRFVARGSARLEAKRGEVRLASTQAAPLGYTLRAGDRISTGHNSWAELGFSGGGYLRLQAESALSVLRIDRTAAGQQVWLQLMRGRAWNVLEPGSGGYRITTPAVSTAVRGTVYRVDAGGLVKVFEGHVATDSAEVSAGQQLEVGGTPAPIVPDEIDEMNMALDSVRAAPFTLQIPAWEKDLPEALSRQSLLELAALATPQSEVALKLEPLAGGPTRAWALEPDVPAWTSAEGKLYKPGPRTYCLPPAAGVTLRRLPAGDYRVTVTAERYGHELQQTRTLHLQGTPPPKPQANE